jgi:glycerol uptake facilitator-like aquaporin
MSLRKDHPWWEFSPYVVAQILGGRVGTLVAHGMFGLPLFELAIKAGTGTAQWFAEFVATFGLIVTILSVSRFRQEAIPVAVGLYITAAYWFTASTSFANPAVTIARALTDSFSGIAPADVPMFIVAQFVGALTGLAVMGWFFATSDTPARFAAPDGT